MDWNAYRRLEYNQDGVAVEAHVDACYAFLDKRLAWWTEYETNPGAAPAGTESDRGYGSEIVSLVSLLEGSAKSRTPARRAALEALRASMPKEKASQSRLIDLAIAGLGGDAPTVRESLGYFLCDADTASEILEASLKRCSPAVCIALLPCIVRVKSDAWKTWRPRLAPEVGMQQVYPVREAVAACLKKVGVGVVLQRQSGTGEVLVSIDEASLASVLKSLVLGEDRESSNNGLDAAAALAKEHPDVEAMLRELAAHGPSDEVRRRVQSKLKQPDGH